MPPARALNMLRNVSVFLVTTVSILLVTGSVLGRMWRTVLILLVLTASVLLALFSELCPGSPYHAVVSVLKTISGGFMDT